MEVTLEPTVMREAILFTIQYDYMPVMFIFLSYYSFILLHMMDVLIMIE
jgi:hypothetical protein